jgi:prepilin-type processing-associated H-X9-DG protein
MSQANKSRFQFTLRQLLAAMAGVCVLAAACYWMGVGPAIFTFIVLASLTSAGFYVLGLQFVEAGVVAAIVVALAYLLLPAVQSARETPRWVSCQYDMRNIALALQSYEADYGTFPPAYIADADGRPMHSWRVLLLPYLDQNNVYKQYRFDEPWDGPNNSALAVAVGKMRCYSCLSSTGNAETNYLAVTGSQTMWPEGKATKTADAKDGAGNTILLVEVHSSGIHWMEPRDLEMSQMMMEINSPKGPSICSAHPQGLANVVFVDGSAQAIDNRASAKAIRAALTISGGEKERLPVTRLPR